MLGVSYRKYNSQGIEVGAGIGLGYITAHEWVNADRLEILRAIVSNGGRAKGVGSFLTGVDQGRIVVDYRVKDIEAEMAFGGGVNRGTIEEFREKVGRTNELLESRREDVLVGRPDWVEECGIETIGDLMDYVNDPEKLREVGYRKLITYKVQVGKTLRDKESRLFLDFYNSVCNDIQILPREFWQSFKEVRPSAEYKFIDDKDIEIFKKSDSFKNLMCKHVERVMELYPNGLDIKELKEKVNSCLREDRDLFNEVMRSLIMGERIVKVAEGEYSVKRCIRVLDGIKGIEKSRNVELLSVRLEEGKTLQEIGDLFDISKERVRQVEKRYFITVRSIIGKRLYEERFRELFNRYDISIEEFREIFKSDCNMEAVIEVTQSERRPISEAVKDADIPYCQKRLISEYLVHKYRTDETIQIDGVRVRKEKEAVYRFVVQRYALDSVTAKELLEKMGKKTVEELVDSGYTAFSCSEVLERAIVRLPFVINTFGKRFRYYDMVDYDFKELLSLLNYKKMNCTFSVGIWVRQNDRIMEMYDIRDEYELHSLLRVLWAENEEVEFMRTPVINVVGGKTEEELIMEVLEREGVISTVELSKMVDRKYGLKISSIFTKYPNTFYRRYTLAGKVYFEEKIFDAKELKLIKKNLVEKEVYEYSKVMRGIGEIIGDKTIELSYHQVRQLGISIIWDGKYVSENVFGAVKFDRERGEYEERKRFVPKSRNLRASEEGINADVEEIEAFMTDIVRVAEQLEYFNTKNLMDMGYWHPIYDNELGNEWYDTTMGNHLDIEEFKYRGIRVYRLKSGGRDIDFLTSINEELAIVGLGIAHREEYIQKKYVG